GSM
ncbi:calcineurin-like phosphoesterase family protein, partial [Vibrio parahaemolyticus V-223/04]